MALNHSGNTDFGGGHYGLNLIWSASQSISGNYSDITATLQISAYGGYSIVANATKYGHITIDGQQFDFSAVVGTLKASNSPKTLATATKRVYHNADGSKYLYASASFALNATLSGSWVGTISTAADYSIDTIPRASSISTPNFTVGDNVTVSISRASSSFTHSIQLDVGGVAIKTASGVGASHTWTFTEADVKKIYAAMGSATSGAVVLWCNTYSGSTLVGDAKGTATCYQVGNSTLQTAPTFVVGDSRTYTVDRLRGSVSHTLQLFAGSTLIRTATGVGTSYSLALTEAEIAKVYALGTSVPTRMVCTAYHCGRNIGTSQQTGTASAPPVSSITSKPDHTIGSGYTVSISRSRNAVSHTLRLYVAGRQIKEISGVANSYTWTPTAAEIAAEYAATPNSNSAAAQATVWCYHYGKLIGTATASGTATVNPAAAAPVFAGYSFADVRPDTVALTGNDQTLVAGESTLKVTIPAAQAASSTTSATIKQYILYCGGATASAAFSASDVTIQLAGTSSGSIRVAAVDSRGNQTIVERLASLVAYTPPRVTQMQLRRDNNVDNKTKLAVKGVWWPGNFGAADNALTSAYQYKVTSAEQYTDGGAVSISITGGEWSFEGYLPGDLGAGGFDFQKSFSVILSATDALNTATASGIIDRGIPTMHMDKGGVGIGKIRETGALDVAGEAYSNGTKLVSKADLLNMVYPVGSIYISTAATSPATFLGGTWERIQDRMLMAAGSTYGAGSTGGAATHGHGNTGAASGSTANSSALTSGANNGSTGSTALTINQIPSHEHGVPFRNTSASQSSNYDILDYYAWGKQYIVGSTKATGGGQGHTHTLGNHSHTIPAHSHGLNSHTHTTGTASNLPPYLAVYVWKRTA